MASNHTPEYGLNQWSLEDSVIMEEFNTDNRSIEQALLALKAGLPKFQSGSFTLTSNLNHDEPYTLSFDFPPQLVILTQAVKGAVTLAPTVLLRGVGEQICPVKPGSFTEFRPVAFRVTWEGSQVIFTMQSEYLPTGTYHYMAIG